MLFIAHYKLIKKTKDIERSGLNSDYHLNEFNANHMIPS